MPNELLEMVRRGMVENVITEQINGASIDLTLGDAIYIESHNGHIVELSQRHGPNMRRISLTELGGS